MFVRHFYGRHYFGTRYFGPRLVVAVETQNGIGGSGAFYYIPPPNRLRPEPTRIDARASGALLVLQLRFIAGDVMGTARGVGVAITQRTELRAGKGRGNARAGGFDILTAKPRVVAGAARGNARTCGAEIRMPGDLDIERDNAFLLAS